MVSSSQFIFRLRMHSLMEISQLSRIRWIRNVRIFCMFHVNILLDMVVIIFCGCQKPTLFCKINFRLRRRKKLQHTPSTIKTTHIIHIDQNESILSFGFNFSKQICGANKQILWVSHSNWKFYLNSRNFQNEYFHLSKFTA